MWIAAEPILPAGQMRRRPAALKPPEAVREPANPGHRKNLHSPAPLCVPRAAV
jgi:hypothetical protein